MPSSEIEKNGVCLGEKKTTLIFFYIISSDNVNKIKGFWRHQQPAQHTYCAEDIWTSVKIDFIRFVFYFFFEYICL